MALDTTWLAGVADRIKHENYFIVFTQSTSGKRFSVKPVKNIISGDTYIPAMMVPDGASATLFPLQGKTSLGGMKITLLDKDGEISTYLATEVPGGGPVDTMVNTTIHFYSGYDIHDEANYQKRFEAVVSVGPKYVNGNRAVELNIIEARRTSRETIMVNSNDLLVTFIEGNLINIYFAISTGNFANVSFPVIVTGQTPTGLAIPEANFDQAGLIAERDTWMPNHTMKFPFTAPENGNSFFEREIFKPFGYPITTAEGLLSFKGYHRTAPNAQSLSITREDIIGDPDWERRHDLHVNAIQIYGDFDEVTGDFTLLASFIDVTDVLATKEEVPFIVQSKGLQTALGGVATANVMIERLKNMFLKPPIQVTLKTHLTKQVGTMGDTVLVTHDDLLDNITGARGWVNRPVEIIYAGPNYGRGEMEFRVLDVQFGDIPFLWAPNTVTQDYDSATSGEIAVYGWWADAAGLLGTANDPGKIWS